MQNHELLEWMTKLRRWSHRYPGLDFDEHETQEKLLEVLQSVDIEGRMIAGTAAIANIRSARPGKTITLRSEIDALVALVLGFLAGPIHSSSKTTDGQYTDSREEEKC